MHTGKYCNEAILNASLALRSDINSKDGKSWVESFENTFANFVGSNYAIAVNSGTSGLHAALLAIGVGPGDEVISPALTVIMDTFSTLYTGATPVWADVEKKTWNIDPEDIERKITCKTKAIISVSWFGLPANLDAINKIAKKHNLIVIDDSAETIFANKPGEEKSKNPDIRVYSFESKKHMSTGGEGGMVTTDNPMFAEKIRKAAGLGYKHLSSNAGRTSLAAKVFQNPNYSRFDNIGFNYRMTPVTAAIGIGQMTNLNNLLNYRIECAKLFSTSIKNYSWLRMQNDSFTDNHSYYTFGVEFLSENVDFTWQQFYNKFTEIGGHGFYANCLNPYLEPVIIGKRFGDVVAAKGLNPIAETLQSKIMAFKTNYLDMSVLQRQCELLIETCIFFEKT